MLDSARLSGDGITPPSGEQMWLNALLDALPDPVLLVDSGLVIRGMNTAARDLVSSSADLVGQGVARLLAAGDADVLGRTQAAVGDGAVWEAAAEVLTEDGDRLPVRLRTAPLRPDGRLAGGVLTLLPRNRAAGEPIPAQGVDLAEELAHALRNDQIALHYQPIVQLQDRQPVAAEALVRWEHPERGLLLPADFLAAADTPALAWQLGLRVLRSACHAAAGWRRMLPAEMSVQVTVNLSERQLLQPGVAALVREALSIANCPPERLLLEVAEGGLLRDPDAAVGALRELKNVGVDIAIDDLGTGSSPLSYLKRFPVDLVKIDRSLVSGIGREADATAVVASLVSLSQAMGVRCVAEGVETADQLSVLRRLGCELGQGYMFTRPMSTSGASDWLARALSPRAPSARGKAADPVAVRRALELQAEGASLHTVAARLNAEGHRSAGGRRWHHTSVAQIIAADRYPNLGA